MKSILELDFRFTYLFPFVHWHQANKRWM